MWTNGDICPGCSKPLNKDEDIVVCPVCGTPQHRECWRKNNACVNEHLHDEGYVWTSSVKEEERKETPNSEPSFTAGERNDARRESADPYGEEPRSPFERPSFAYATAIPPEALIDGIPAIELAQVVQTKVPRYISRFFRIDQTNVKIGWNWGVCILALLFSIFWNPISLFFPALWFFYRKMPKIGALVLAGALFFSVANISPSDARLYYEIKNASEQVMENSGIISVEQFQEIIDKVIQKSGYTSEELKRKNVLNILAHAAIFGLASFGDYLYLGDIKKRINKARKTATEPAQYQRLLYEMGGTSLGSALIAAVVYFFIDTAVKLLVISILA